MNAWRKRQGWPSPPAPGGTRRTVTLDLVEFDDLPVGGFALGQFGLLGVEERVIAVRELARLTIMPLFVWTSGNRGSAG
jgi:hypothetical protein